MEHTGWLTLVRGVPGVARPWWGQPWWGQTLVGTTPPGQRANPRFLPHPSTSAEHIWSQPAPAWSHTSLQQPLDTIHSAAEHRHTPHTPKTVSGHTSRVSCQGCHPRLLPPSTQHPTHADAPHYPPPPLIQQIRKVGDVFPATFALSVHTPIISNIAIIAIIISIFL